MIALGYFLRALASVGIAFFTLALSPAFVAGGFAAYAVAWLLPGKILVAAVSAVLPGVGLASSGVTIATAFVFWSVVIFLFWEKVRRRKLKLLQTQVMKDSPAPMSSPE